MKTYLGALQTVLDKGTQKDSGRYSIWQKVKKF